MNNNGKFAPTDKQLAFLEATLELGFSATRAIRCKRANVTSKTVRRWLDNPRFEQWFSREYEGSIRSSIMGVYAAHLEKATKGDIHSARLVLERFDPEFSTEKRRETSSERIAEITIRRVVELAKQNGACCEAESGSAGVSPATDTQAAVGLACPERSRRDGRDCPEPGRRDGRRYQGETAGGAR